MYKQRIRGNCSHYQRPWAWLCHWNARNVTSIQFCSTTGHLLGKTKCHFLGQGIGLSNLVQSVPAHKDLIVSWVRETLKQETFLEVLTQTLWSSVVFSHVQWGKWNLPHTTDGDRSVRQFLEKLNTIKAIILMPMMFYQSYEKYGLYNLHIFILFLHNRIPYVKTEIFVLFLINITNT